MLAGLGNPGSKYLLTPHNIGWMVVDTLAQYYNVQLRSKGSYVAEVAHVWEPSSFAHSKLQIREKKSYMSDSVQIQDQKVILIKPMTYMNLSGQAVREALSYYRLSIDQLLVVHDDIDLPFLNMKFQKNRGPAGHNGIKSIHSELKSQDYIRWRIGIGQYDVLKPFAKKEQVLLTDFLSSTIEAFEYFLKNGLEKTAGQYNTIQNPEDITSENNKNKTNTNNKEIEKPEKNK